MDRPAGDIDRISALPDELLHVILTFLRDAPAITRTAVLCRRWRHVWTGANNLEFKDSDKHLQISIFQLAGFVDWVLARRGQADMESLRIQFRGSRASPEQLNEWLRYAAQHVVKSLDIVLERWCDQPDQQVVVELTSHCKAASISLSLPNYRFRLPATAAARYEALTKLELFSLSFHEDGGSTLGDFVTSCCPRLRKLHISTPKRLRHLVLRSEVLEEFVIFLAKALLPLDMVTPNLRVFNLSWCFTYRLHVDDNTKLVRVVAPKLEEIGSLYYDQNRSTELYIHGLTSVRRLNQLHVGMQGKYHADTDVGFWLLESCPNVEHVNLWLEHEEHEYSLMGELVDLTSEGKAPFAKLRCMFVSTYHFPKDHLLASMSALLLRCAHLASLNIAMDYYYTGESIASCSCDVFTDICEIHGKIALESLEEVKIYGFTGTEVEMQLVRLLFESFSSINRMNLIHASAAKENNKVSIETIYDELLTIVPSADLGRWCLSEGTFTWTCNATS